MGAFITVNRQFRLAVISILSSFHLNKNNIIAINRNDINLLTIRPPISFKDFVALIFEIMDSEIFTDFA